MHGFKIGIRPAQSPDLNVDDLSSSRSLQSDVSLVAKDSRRDLLQPAIQYSEEYQGKRWSQFGMFVPGSSTIPLLYNSLDCADRLTAFWSAHAAMTTNATGTRGRVMGITIGLRPPKSVGL